jgi:hypothetical protein
MNLMSAKTLFGATGPVAERVPFAEAPNCGSSQMTFVMSPNDLKGTLGEPEMVPGESPEAWGEWTWSFKLPDGTHGSIRNYRRGGFRWYLMVEEGEGRDQAHDHSVKLVDALVDIFDKAGLTLFPNWYLHPFVP